MSKKWFLICRGAIILSAATLIGWSIAIGNPIIPVIAVIMAVGLLFLCRRRLKEVIEDERNYRISEKASRSTIRIFAFAIVIIGAFLTASGIGFSLPFPIKEVGFTLSFSACALLIIYVSFYTYYRKKT